jgi:hypothetical protein
MSMWLIATMLFASAAAGLVIGPWYNVYMLVVASLAIALVSATATRLDDFTFWASCATTFACITTSQLAYLLVTWLHVKPEPSSEEPSHDRVGDYGQSDISNKDDQHQPPSYLAK